MASKDTTDTPVDILEETTEALTGTTDIIGLLRRKAWLITLTTLIAIVVAVGATYLLPEVYVASALVQLLPEEIDLGSDRMPVHALGALKDPPLTLAQTASKILTSREMAKELMKRAKLPKQEKLSWRKKLTRNIRNIVSKTWILLRYGRINKVSPREKTILFFQGSISPSQIKDTFLIEVRANTDDPKKSAAIANKAAELFVVHRRRSALADGDLLAGALEAELNKVSEQLTNEETALGEFQKKEGLIALDEDSINKLQTMSSLDILSRQLQKTKTTNPALQELRQRTPDLPGIAVELNKLKRAVERAKKQYDQVAAELTEVKLQTARNLSETKIIDRAAPPIYQTKPIKLYYGLAATFLGLIVGITLAFISDRRAASRQGM